MKPPTRVIITDCPHGGRHTGVKGYVVDTYSDGTASVDMGHNVCCITNGYEEVEPVRRQDLIRDEDGLTDVRTPDQPKKRRGRPRKVGDVPKAQATPTTDVVPPSTATVQSRTVPTLIENLLAVTTVNEHGASLTYKKGETGIDLQNASVEDLLKICSIVETLTR